MINSLLPINGTISIYRDCTIAIGDEKLSEAEVLAVAKCYLSNAKLTCDAILKGRLTSLDPIVGENACQIRALAAISAHVDADLKKELIVLCERLNQLVISTVKLIDTLGTLKTRPSFNADGGLLEQLDSLGLSLSVSEKIDYLLRSHLLTVGKYFYMNSKGQERSGIDCQKMKDKLKTKLGRDLLEKMVGIAQEKIALDSVRFLQMQAAGTTLETRVANGAIRVIKPNNLELHSSCALYNLKVVMLRASEMQIPILIKEHGVKNPMGIYFRANEPLVEELKKDQAILVIECFFPENSSKEAIVEGILQHGLLELVLANVACTPQYSADDEISHLEQESQEEILKYRALGKDLGCQTASPAVFSIAHVHAATVNEEKIK